MPGRRGGQAWSWWLRHRAVLLPPFSWLDRCEVLSSSWRKSWKGLSCDAVSALFTAVVNRAAEPELKPKWFWMAGIGAKSFWWWSRSRSLKFGFRFHRHSSWGKRFYNAFWFSMDQIVLEHEPDPPDVGAGAKKFRCLELDAEPKIWVPSPQPLVTTVSHSAARLKIVFWAVHSYHSSLRKQY